MSLDALRAAVKRGQVFSYLPFFGHTAPPDGMLTRSCLSQWWPAPFVVGDQRYATAEHFMMASKARTFGDPEHLRAILEAKTPADAKKLGRAVRGFDAARWSAVAFDCVVQGSVAKFSSTPQLRAFLASTGEAILVEASPRDTIWGIGLGPTNPAVHDPAKWRGKNQLGFALTRARWLLSGASSPAASS
jgi:ribA/ribD-fused uncharacterized protein